MAASFADLRKKFAKLSTAVADGLLEWQILQVRVSKSSQKGVSILCRLSQLSQYDP